MGGIAAKPLPLGRAAAQPPSTRAAAAAISSAGTVKSQSKFSAPRYARAALGNSSRRSGATEAATAAPGGMGT